MEVYIIVPTFSLLIYICESQFPLIIVMRIGQWYMEGQLFDKGQNIEESKKIH